MLSDDFREFIAQRDRLVVEMVANLEAELIRKTPVDTGQLKAAWQTDKLIDGSYILSNNMNYADSIFRGIRLVPTKSGGMKTVGSKQMPAGAFVIVEKHLQELDKRLKLLKG